LYHITPYPHLPSTPASRQNLFCTVLLQFCWREKIRDNKKDIMFLLVWDKDSYIEGFLALLPCTCVLQPTLVHLYQTSSLLSSPLPIVASASLRLLYLLLNREHINHNQVLGFLPCPYSSRVHSPLNVWPMSNILLHLFWAYNLHMRRTCSFRPSEPGWFHLRWCSLVPSIYLQMKNFILLCGWVKFHCI
jgi:hypothetical protein